MIEIPEILKKYIHYIFDIKVNETVIVRKTLQLITHNKGDEFIYILKALFNEDDFRNKFILFAYISWTTNSKCVCTQSIEHLYYIKHIRTDTIILVGSVCVEKMDKDLYNSLTFHKKCNICKVKMTLKIKQQILTCEKCKTYRKFITNKDTILELCDEIKKKFKKNQKRLEKKEQPIGVLLDEIISKQLQIVKHKKEEYERLRFQIETKNKIENQKIIEIHRQLTREDEIHRQLIREDELQIERRNKLRTFHNSTCNFGQKYSGKIWKNIYKDKGYINWLKSTWTNKIDRYVNNPLLKEYIKYRDEYCDDLDDEEYL